MVVVASPQLVCPSKPAVLMKSKKLAGECQRSSGLLMLCCGLLCVSAGVGWYFLIHFVFSLFLMRNFNYYLDKCGVLNKIIEPTIFIFKINTNKICNTHLRRISKHNIIPIGSVKIPTKH